MLEYVIFGAIWAITMGGTRPWWSKHGRMLHRRTLVTSWKGAGGGEGDKTGRPSQRGHQMPRQSRPHAGEGAEGSELTHDDVEQATTQRNSGEGPGSRGRLARVALVG